MATYMKAAPVNEDVAGAGVVIGGGGVVRVAGVPLTILFISIIFYFILMKI